MTEIKDIIGILVSVFSCGAVYGLIRADLKNLHDKHASQEREAARIEHSVMRAHDRIDGHVTDYHRRNT